MRQRAAARRREPSLEVPLLRTARTVTEPRVRIGEYTLPPPDRMRFRFQLTAGAGEAERLAGASLGSGAGSTPVCAGTARSTPVCAGTTRGGTGAVLGRRGLGYRDITGYLERRAYAQQLLQPGRWFNAAGWMGRWMREVRRGVVGDRERGKVKSGKGKGKRGEGKGKQVARDERIKE